MIALAFAAASLAGHAAAATPSILARPGGTYEARAADQTRCAEAARRSPMDDLPLNATPTAVPSDGYLTHAAGAVLANMLLLVVEVEKGRGRAQAFCLRNLGYVAVPLTPEEEGVYAGLSTAAKQGWERTFLAGDLTDRVALLTSPVAPRLPPYRDEPFSQGGLKIDATSLTASVGDVKEKAPLVTGKAERWRTATLATPIATTEGPVQVAADPGAVFHQVDYRDQQEPLMRPDTATWCGPVRQVVPAGGAKATYCFTGHDDGYGIYRPSGQPWFAGPYRDGFTLPAYRQPIRLDERPTDDLGPLEFEIVAQDISRSAVTLAGNVRRAGRQTQLWVRRLSFDPQGHAVLPLWSKRLIVSPAGPDAVRVELDSGGDGRGWRPGG